MAAWPCASHTIRGDKRLSTVPGPRTHVRPTVQTKYRVC